MKMEEVRIIRRVTKNLIHEIVDRIVKAIDPEKIILFGSYAYGRPRNSYMDLQNIEFFQYLSKFLVCLTQCL